MNSTRRSVPTAGRQKGMTCTFSQNRGMILHKRGDKALFQTMINRTELLSTFQINDLRNRLEVLNSSKLIELADLS